MNNKYKYKGMWPVAPTPFHENGEVDYEGMGRVIDCMVRLAKMFGYVNTLRSMSQGRAQFTMQFDHYDQVPQAVAEEVIAKMA